MMRLINEDDVLEIIERVTNEAVEKKQPKYLIQPRIIAEIAGLPTIEAEPVNTDKCKALRNIEGIRLILSNVYNTGSTLQDCDYDAIYKQLDVIENILKGK